MIDTPNDPELLPLDEVRRRYCLEVLEACGGNRTNAARVLKLDRKTLYRRLLRWGVVSRTDSTDGEH